MADVIEQQAFDAPLHRHVMNLLRVLRRRHHGEKRAPYGVEQEVAGACKHVGGFANQRKKLDVLATGDEAIGETNELEVGVGLEGGGEWVCASVRKSWYAADCEGCEYT